MNSAKFFKLTLLIPEYSKVQSLVHLRIYSKTAANIVECFKTKILRRIFGQYVIKNNGDLELRRLYRDMSASEFIRFKCLQWAGRVIRMESDRIPKTILQVKFDSHRAVESTHNR